MGSAITFTDKIANKNCQNLQDHKEPLCNHNNRWDHVEIQYEEDSSEELEKLATSSASASVNCKEKRRKKVYLKRRDHHRLNSINSRQFTDDDDDLDNVDDFTNHHEDTKHEEESPKRSRCSCSSFKKPTCGKLGSFLIRNIKQRGTIKDSMGRRCLCDTIKPILKLSQLLGVIPLRLNHPRNDEGEKVGLCELKFQWRSLPTILNTSFIMFFILITPFAHAEIRDRMKIVFSGTDLYAFTLQTMAMVLETAILLTVGRLYKGKFSKGWSSLNEVFHAICDSADDLKQIKVGSYITALIIMGQGFVFFAFMYWTSHRAIGLYQSCSALLIGTFVISLTLIIPYIMSTLFLFICLLIRSHFLKISDMLRTVVSKHYSSHKLSAKIDSLRVLHEQLCQTVTYFEDFFGFQVLLTLCTCCFTVTVGAYACILQGEEMSSPKGNELTGAWGMQLYCAAIFILLILISGQLVTNAAASPGPVLNAIPLSELDEKSQTQVTAFLNKISAFPTKMSAVKITTISTTFLASAATNITTYLLVLMQFKLSLEKDKRLDEDADNLTMAGFEMDSSTEPIFYNVTTESLAFLTESL